LFEIQDKLDPFQFGGIRGSSTTMALIDMIHKWHTAIHAKDSIQIVFLDYSKAFDLVDHSTLIKKFQKLSLSEVPLYWLCGFLACRRQRVKLGNEISEWLVMKGAMPQGSWLGPLCFIVYIHDMPTIKEIFTHKYIDDTTLTEVVKKNVKTQMNTALENIEKWSAVNQMKINAKKTKHMTIHFKRKPLEIDPVQVNNTVIETVKNFKILGVWVSSNLKWDCHHQKIISKLSQRLYLLKQLKRSGLGTDDLIVYYKSVLRSIAEYACQVWHSGLTKAQTTSLEHQQERALRIILPDKDYESALQETGLEKLVDRREAACKKLFRQMESTIHRLHKLMPERKNHRYETSHANQRKVTTPLNNRYKTDFVINGLLKFQ